VDNTDAEGNAVADDSIIDSISDGCGELLGVINFPNIELLRQRGAASYYRTG